jgi:hypothetical protein
MSNLKNREFEKIENSNIYKHINMIEKVREIVFGTQG